MTDDPKTVDQALEIATTRTKAAENEFLAKPIDDPDALGTATEVKRRAEDLAVLSEEALEASIAAGEASPVPVTPEHNDD